MSKRKRGIICAYCGMAWGYDDESPTPELIKEACDHETICEKNPYTAQIRNLKRERDEAREDAEHWKTEYKIVADRLRGKKHERDNGIIAEDEIIPKLTRERDELQKAINGLCEHFKISPANTTLLAVEVLRIEREHEEAITRCMETIMQCELYEQERDEALMDRANGDIATMTRNHYERILRERDEAREKAERYRIEANAMMMQRDEARGQVNRYRYNLDLLPIKWDI